MAVWFALFQSLPIAIPPTLNFASKGIHRRLFLVHLPMYWQPLFFPPADGAFITFQIGGDFFPGVQLLTRNFADAAR